MKKKRILIVTADMGLGGVQRKVVDLVNYAAKKVEYQNVEFHLFSRLPSHFSFQKEMNGRNVFIHQLRLKILRRYKLQFCYLFLFWMTYVYKPTSILIFSHEQIPYVLLGKILFFWRTKLVVSNDNILSLYNQTSHIDKVFSQSSISLLFRFADKVITQTQYAKNDLVHNFNVLGKKISVIPNWFLSSRKLSLRKKKKYDLIYCGRFAHQKRLDLYLEVVKKVQIKLPHISACLIGEGPEEVMIKQKVLSLGLSKNVTIKKPVLRILDQLAESKILLLTASFEGHPMVILEAMAQEVVPVVIRYPGVSEYVIHGRTGFIERSVPALAQRILNLLQQSKLRKKVGKQAKEEVTRVYNEQKIEELLSLLL